MTKEDVNLQLVVNGHWLPRVLEGLIDDNLMHYTGKVLPPQLICTGKTARCYPTGIPFPDDWNITHSTNHQSNEEIMLEFAGQVLSLMCNLLKSHFRSSSFCSI